jgi:hypothetical protein
MKIRFQKARASALLTALLCAAVLGIAAAGLVGYVQSQYALDGRSHQWNQALYLAEGAVDMAYAELNYQYLGGTGFTAARGWTNLGSGSYQKTVSGLTDCAGSPVGDMTVTVSAVASNNPTASGVGTCAGLGKGPSVSRAVKVILQTQQTNSFGFLCRSFVKLNGTTTSVDSYDSSDPAKSTGGLYDPAKRQANGNIGVLNSAGLFSVSASSGNGDVYGKFFTPPGGVVTMGAGASVGATFVSAARAYTVPDGEVKGWILHNLSMTMPDVTVPSDLSSLALGPDITSSRTLSAGDYKVNKISLSGGKTLNIDGAVRIYLTSDLSLSGTGQVVINSGATLDLYIAGKIGDSGQGVLNSDGKPKTCHIYGLPSATAAWTLSGSAAFYGIIYAPKTPITMSGGGSAYCGSLWCDSVTSSGSVIFHFDENGSASSPYSIVSWQELRKVAGVWVP